MDDEIEVEDLEAAGLGMELGKPITLRQGSAVQQVLWNGPLPDVIPQSRLLDDPTLLPTSGWVPAAEYEFDFTSREFKRVKADEQGD